MMKNRRIEAALGQMLRFGVSGAVNTLVYVACGKGLLAIGVGHAGTGAIALLMASASGYALHRVFSFKSKNERSAEATRFAVLVAANAGLSSFALPALVKHVGLPDTAALMAVSMVLPVTNFLAMKLWIFRVRSIDTVASQARQTVV